MDTVLLAALSETLINRFFQWRYDTALVFVRITPGVVLRSIVVAVPPTIAPGLNVRCASPPSFSRKVLRIFAASKIAPLPIAGVKICDECLVFAFTVRRHDSVPRRAVIAAIPLTLLMIVYTAISLSVIAEPLVQFRGAEGIEVSSPVK